MADLLVGDFSTRRQLLPAEQQWVCHLSEWVQVDQPHSALQNTHNTMSVTQFARGIFENWLNQNSLVYLLGYLCRHQTQLQNRKKKNINHYIMQ